MKNKERLGYGGFFLDNIKESIERDCFESGDPIAYFKNLMIIMEELTTKFELGEFLDEYRTRP